VRGLPSQLPPVACDDRLPDRIRPRLSGAKNSETGRLPAAMLAKSSAAS